MGLLASELEKNVELDSVKNDPLVTSFPSHLNTREDYRDK